VTAGQRGDSPQLTVVLDAVSVARPGRRPRTRPDRALADKAYGGRANRACLRRRKIAATIPEQADRLQHRKNKGSEGGRPPSTRPSTSSATPSNAASTGSSATAPSPPATTN
jgi:hypothetical protein